MPIIISEIVIDSAGRIAVELYNNDSSGFINLQGYRVNLFYGSTLQTIPINGTTRVNDGEYFTIGHSAFSGLDRTGYDSSFASTHFKSAFLRDSGFTSVDHAFSGIGPVLGSNKTFQTLDLNRAPDGNTSADNSAAFGEDVAANNTLGAACFLRGTRIATPQGARAVEDLAPGDLVRTAEGRVVPVLWLGRQEVRARIGVAPQGLELVRIARGALGNHSDLFVTADHGMVLDGYLVEAGALVNGVEITFAPYDGAYTVFHVETAAHEVLLANGAQAESFLPLQGRAGFDNASGALDRIIPEMPLPRISARRLLPPELAGFGARPLGSGSYVRRCSSSRPDGHSSQDALRRVPVRAR